ncbi:hypothetical protein, partial [Clavibacter phaseoli]|uniref:hypothetical protein n=1 Tax=Clavibacter phaseoli TaxID=1734031 RepID=UPI002175283E
MRPLPDDRGQPLEQGGLVLGLEAGDGDVEVVGQHEERIARVDQSTMVTFTSMLPRVALEYGQT